VNHVSESATDAHVLTGARRKLGRSVPTLLVRRVLFTISKLYNDLIAPRISSDAGAMALTDAIRVVAHSPAVPRHVIDNSLTDGQAVFVESYQQPVFADRYGLEGAIASSFASWVNDGVAIRPTTSIVAKDNDDFIAILLLGFRNFPSTRQK
jgi:hypothetical protein